MYKSYFIFEEKYTFDVFYCLNNVYKIMYFKNGFYFLFIRKIYAYFHVYYYRFERQVSLPFVAFFSLILEENQCSDELCRSLMKRAEDSLTSTMSSEEDLRLLAADCGAFRRSRGYFTQPLSQLEADFPVAFSILAYDNIPQVRTDVKPEFHGSSFLVASLSCRDRTPVECRHCRHLVVSRLHCGPALPQ